MTDAENKMLKALVAHSTFSVKDVSRGSFDPSFPVRERFKISATHTKSIYVIDKDLFIDAEQKIEFSIAIRYNEILKKEEYEIEDINVSDD